MKVIFLHYFYLSLCFLKISPFSRYIFSTEGHLLPATPQISLVQEHCSYVGAFCKSAGYKQESQASDIAANLQEANVGRSDGGRVHTGFPIYSTSFESTSTAGLIKVGGFCF
jgi:mannosidase alpha-like ER degradation enhancer 2